MCSLDFLLFQNKLNFFIHFGCYGNEKCDIQIFKQVLTKPELLSVLNALFDIELHLIPINNKNTNEHLLH